MNRNRLRNLLLGLSSLAAVPACDVYDPSLLEPEPSPADASTPPPSICERAERQLVNCGVVTSPDPDAGAVSCSMTDCKAACVNESTCDDLVDAFNGTPSAGNPFLLCWSSCN